MTNAYVTVATIKSSGNLNITGTGTDDRIRQMVEAYSRNVDQYCHRHFFSQIATRYFSGGNRGYLLLQDDLVAVTSIGEDEDGDAVYEETWASTDFELSPYDALPTGAVDLLTTRPYSRIEVNQRSTGSRFGFYAGQKRYSILGEWGYSRSTQAALGTVSGAHTAAVTTLTLTDRTGIEIGHTLRIGSEQMYVTAMPEDGATVTVQRGVNGTTAAALVGSEAVNIVQYPADVREAVLIEVSRMWTMKNSGFASSVGIPEEGTMQIFGGALQPRARDLLNYYRLIPV